MDDSEALEIEERLRRIASTDAPALAAKARQFEVLQVLNALESAMRQLAIERAFGERQEGQDANVPGPDGRLAPLRVRYEALFRYLEPETRRWSEDLAHALRAGVDEKPPPAPRPQVVERAARRGRGTTLTRLVPIQVRISRPQELALEQAKYQTGRTVSQLLRDALTVDRIRDRRQWNRTDSGGQLTIKRWVRCDSATVRALQLVSMREHLTLSDAVRSLLDDAIRV
jgi:hypothetical protein